MSMFTANPEIHSSAKRRLGCKVVVKPLHIDFLSRDGAFAAGTTETGCGSSSPPIVPVQKLKSRNSRKRQN
jgi:hypothetical protein